MQWWWCLEFREQFGFRVGPFDRFGMGIKVSKIGSHVTLQGAEAWEITRREQVTLDLAKDDLDLIQPAGVLGEPVQAHLKGERERRQPRPELLGRMSRTVVEDQMEGCDPSTKRALKERLQKGFEVDKLLGHAGLSKGQPAGHDQGTEELQRAHPFIAISHLHDFARGCGFRREIRGILGWPDLSPGAGDGSAGTLRLTSGGRRSGWPEAGRFPSRVKAAG